MGDLHVEGTIARFQENKTWAHEHRYSKISTGFIVPLWLLLSSHKPAHFS